RRVILTVTDTFLDAIRAPHNLKTSATVTTPSGGTLDVLVNDGTVMIDRTADQRRSLDLTIADPMLYPEATSDPLNVYGHEITTTDTTTIPKHHVDRDRWAEIQRVAQVIGCEAFFDAHGNFVIQDVPDPTTAAPVWTVDAGPGGVLIGTQDSVTREGAPNAVI